MDVEYIDHMGDDLMVVNAARVSFHKESEPHPSGSLYERDEKLIRYLAKHGHWSPFSHPQVTFRVKAPIFVARQLVKHQVGLAWNEVSRRYVDDVPRIYIPETWRKRAENKKQGSSTDTVERLTFQDPIYGVETKDTPSNVVEEVMTTVVALYLQMLDAGVCPEQARMVLPQSMYTEWYWTGSLYAWARVCKQRLDDHAQAETREIAAEISGHMHQLFPNSWRELLSN